VVKFVFFPLETKKTTFFASIFKFLGAPFRHSCVRVDLCLRELTLDSGKRKIDCKEKIDLVQTNKRCIGSRLRACSITLYIMQSTMPDRPEILFFKS